MSGENCYKGRTNWAMRRVSIMDVPSVVKSEITSYQQQCNNGDERRNRIVFNEKQIETWIEVVL